MAKPPKIQGSLLFPGADDVVALPGCCDQVGLVGMEGVPHSPCGGPGLKLCCGGGALIAPDIIVLSNEGGGAASGTKGVPSFIQKVCESSSKVRWHEGQRFILNFLILAF